jgi:hypothetical protein
MAEVDGLPNHVAWWQWIPLPWRRWRLVVRVDAGDEVPERLPTRGVAIVGPIAAPTWIALDCPCKRGHRLMVNSSTARRPNWRIERHKPLTIRPSIDDITPERRCHFTIHQGRTRWAKDLRKDQ